MSETKRKPLYQPWNEEAFRADFRVGAMLPKQRWMYRTLLQVAFFCSTRPHLPDDDAQLWLLAGCENPKQWEREKGPVRAMFTPVEVDGVRLLSQKRLLADWERIEEKRQSLAEAGRKGGLASVKHKVSKCLPEAQAGLKQEKLEGSRSKESGGKEAPASPVPLKECWRALGVSLPIGSLSFQFEWEEFFREHHDHPIVQVMEEFIQLQQARPQKVPPQFYETKHALEGIVRPNGKAASEIPVLNGDE